MNNMIFNMLLGQLKNRNPQGYNQFVQLRNSGKSPDQVINEMLASGQINQNQLNQAKQMANQYNQTNNTNNLKRF